MVALYFHSSTLLLSFVPLLIGWPSHPTWLSWVDTTLLVGVAATSFAGQLLLTRGFQLESAGKAAGLNFFQVGVCVLGPGGQSLLEHVCLPFILLQQV